MKISYNWLKEYVQTDLSAETIGELLTGCGLEVESIEKFETIKGSLNGLVVGYVVTRDKHPDADRLSITTVDVGTDTLLNIVCGAPNVAAGQKVIVATIGAKLYPSTGEPFEIKKSKIRGQVSEGMICAEDEIGLGVSHSGIMVLDNDAQPGTPAKDYFAQQKNGPKVEEDYIFEIGLTPNRADAASHVGVARDLVAVLNCRSAQEKTTASMHPEIDLALRLPSVNQFKVDNHSHQVVVEVEDTLACPRYSGLTITGVKVGESPEWLKNRLKAIGVRPINNIVDITNYVLHELGQPMHAFDLEKIKSNKVIVKKLVDKTPFKTLDDVQRELSNEDLMICAVPEKHGGIAIPMCIAGVFGGSDSGITENTTSVFLESAYFNSTSIRKSSKRHGLKTDASFRFERGTDPEITVFALKRAAMLVKEIAGGVISSDIVDVYPQKLKAFKVPFSFANCNRLIGKKMDVRITKTILLSLGITIEHEGQDALLLSVPSYKVDVQREQDVIEEVLRVYGYNKIDIPNVLNSALQYSEKPDKEKVQQAVSELLTGNGFYEIMCLSLTKSEYSDKLNSIDASCNVAMMNPLSSDLNVLRQSTLFSGLETIEYNINRKNQDLRLYEFGKTYKKVNGNSAGYEESRHLSLFVTGQQRKESWNLQNAAVNFFTLKGYVLAVLARLGINNYNVAEYEGDALTQGLAIVVNKKKLVEFGTVSKALLKQMDIKQEVFYADFNWDFVLETLKKVSVMYTEVPKFPEVRRDLALLIDKSVKFEQLEQLAYQSEKGLLKDVNLFDVYEGDKLPAGKKSYAISFTIQDENATLTDKQIEKIMEKLVKVYKDKAGAEIR